jgi:hypothetical protein
MRGIDPSVPGGDIGTTASTAVILEDSATSLSAAAILDDPGTSPSAAAILDDPGTSPSAAVISEDPGTSPSTAVHSEGTALAVRSAWAAHLVDVASEDSVGAAVAESRPAGGRSPG